MKRIGLFLFKLSLSVLAALTVAAGSAWYAMRPNEYGGQIRNGVWTTDLTTGSNAAGLYQRAQVALYGLWAMSSSETIYFIANVDSDGSPLAGNCTYAIDGTDPDARWWSLTVYKNFHLVPNEGKVYSFSKTTVAREPNGAWLIYLSPDSQPKNWLPAGNPDAAGDLKLVFRAYNPSTLLTGQVASVKLPKVVKEHCR